MPTTRTSRRLVAAPASKALAFTALAFMSVFGPALPAAADTDDFDMGFPQSAIVTRFTDSWGEARSGGRAHRGTDLMAPKGTPVFAVADGVVTNVRDGDRSGRWLGVEHADGWETWYMHLNNDNPGTDDGDAAWSRTVAPGIEEGTRVVAGTLLGWVGDSGNAEPSSPHNHFELHRHGTAINPYPYLVPAYQEALKAAAVDVLPALTDLINEMGSSPLRPTRPLA